MVCALFFVFVFTFPARFVFVADIYMRDFTTRYKSFQITQYNKKGMKMYNSIHTHTHTHTHLHEEEEVTRLLIFYLVVVVAAAVVVINQTVHRLPWYPLRLRTSL